MAYNYGYGEMEDQIIDLLKSPHPDFARANELIALGADLNAKSQKEYQDENMLAEILLGFWEICCDKRNTCNRNGCTDCTECLSDAEVGERMLSVVRFFLDHGFDVSRENNMYGAQCLYALSLSTHDKYILPCAKLLLDAGAKDVAFYDDDPEIVSDNVAFESFFQSSEGNQDYSNILEAYYQMITAANEGRDYHSIDCHEAAIGKTISKVFAIPKNEGPIFYDLILPENTYHNCYNATLYFIYDDGYLINTQYAEIWTDASDIPENAVDVSDIFKDLCGSRIRKISFSQTSANRDQTCYTRPIIFVHMDNGYTFKTTINFGDVADEHRAAYYEIIKEDKND